MHGSRERKRRRSQKELKISKYFSQTKRKPFKKSNEEEDLTFPVVTGTSLFHSPHFQAQWPKVTMSQLFLMQFVLENRDDSDGHGNGEE